MDGWWQPSRGPSCEYCPIAIAIVGKLMPTLDKSTKTTRTYLKCRTYTSQLVLQSSFLRSSYTVTFTK